MPLRVEYKASVQRDLRGLGKQAALRILGKIERSLIEEDRGGKALTGEFAGLHSLRVGDYRVIYTRTDIGYLVLRISHRREVYRRGRPRE